MPIFLQLSMCIIAFLLFAVAVLLHTKHHKWKTPVVLTTFCVNEIESTLCESSKHDINDEICIYYNFHRSITL